MISRATLLRWFHNWVLTREADDGHGPSWADDERECRKAGIIKTAEAAGRRAAEIPLRMEEDEEDFVPCVVAEATRLQELANDLLGQCRSSFVP